MGIILALVAFALCAIVYVRMVKREIPEPISKNRQSFLWRLDLPPQSLLQY